MARLGGEGGFFGFGQTHGERGKGVGDAQPLLRSLDLDAGLDIGLFLPVPSHSSLFLDILRDIRS